MNVKLQEILMKYCISTNTWITGQLQDLEFRSSAEATERSERGRLAAAAQTLAAGGVAWKAVKWMVHGW